MPENRYDDDRDSQFGAFTAGIPFTLGWFLGLMFGIIFTYMWFTL